MKKRFFLILLSVLLLTSPIISEAKYIKEEDLWRYDLEKAILFALNPQNLSSISNLAIKLKGSDIKESAWNILKWEEENIEYDIEKAELPPSLIRIYSTGRIEVVQGEENVFQLPSETISKGKGICGDYALLTAGLLLKMDYQPVYILDIEFENDPIKHVVTGIVVNGWLFILDQHPPVMDAGTFYKYWLKHEGKIIKDITLYEIGYEEDIVVKKYGVDKEVFMGLDYDFSTRDLEAISGYLMVKIKDNFKNLVIDPQIASLDKLAYLPRGYTQGKIYSFQFPEFLDYYNPIFHFQFIDYLYGEILDDKNILENIKNFKYFFVRAEALQEDLVIILNLAK
ncbi:hypothetical protein FY122_09260 [Dictyoglomus thermophilum]|jgi:predicted transglutaminase-like protease|uniref:Transglutaminase-like domain-containing protein n=1 Tax=Thermodesulfobacterium geofontis TaxID=1295609 RepID=A0A7C4NV33_9BACT|nr:transglutaminase-like domain-containing protein [Dictyoglomus thermophilum]TYT20930.1 hypothetical protein FY122_09260 [Dictyoglomus thermophilum]